MSISQLYYWDHKAVIKNIKTNYRYNTVYIHSIKFGGYFCNKKQHYDHA